MQLSRAVGVHVQRPYGVGGVNLVMALALVGAAAGALYPAFRAATYDPVVALAYE